MIDNNYILQQKINNLLNAGIECSLFFKKKHEDEANYIFGKTISMTAQLYGESSHNPLLDGINNFTDYGEMCELHLFFDDKPKVVRLTLFELQFNYLNLLLDNLMVRIFDCNETRHLLLDTLCCAKLFNYLTLDTNGRPDVLQNTICIFFELYHLSDKEKIREILVSYLTELDEIDSFDEIYGIMKITPKIIVEFIYFIEYLDVSGNIEKFIKNV